MIDRPTVAITLGDPAGIGPEIVVKALTDSSLYAACRPLVIGHPAVVERARALVTGAGEVHTVQHGNEGTFQPGTLDVYPAGSAAAADVAFGKVSGVAGQAAYACIVASIELAKAGEADAVATAPINKEALQVGGVPYLDHTAMYADLAGREGEVLTLFETGKLKIFFATRHRALKDAIGDLTIDGLCQTIRGANEALAQYGQPGASIAVAALNPHGGEDGMFGDEEIRILRPAVERLKGEGITVSGPYPADSVFVRAARGGFDAVISLYHDQGHIAAKMHDFERTVSITTGLPFVRTSVDHGTAFDIAGTGTASAISMVEAIRAAADYAKRRQPTRR